RLLYAKEFCEAFGLNPVQYAIPLENSYWKNYFPNMVLGEGVIEFLQELKRREKKIGLITDLTTEIQLKKLAFLKIDSYFDAIITSEEAGAEKPSSRIFELAIKKLNAQKLSSIMIGDNYEKDVLGARDFGISSYYFGFREDEELCLPSFREALDKLL
ncbi:MAG TPA: HAD-IA family hydrolase, partial [Leptospiraceae bacterium]|nr:HAD-IA family hydrolase [Leptospiraceae bacterium]